MAADPRCHRPGVHRQHPDLDGPPFNIPGRMNKYSRASFEEYGESIDHSGSTYFFNLTDDEVSDVLAVVRGFAGVPGYVLQEPSGSAADLEASSNVNTARVTKENDRYRVLSFGISRITIRMTCNLTLATN